MSSYEKHGFGLWLVEMQDSGISIGICGLLKRDTLEDVDIGYALVPEFWSNGYGMESAVGVMSYASKDLGLRRVVAVTSADNQSSIRLLEKIGFHFERMIRLSDTEPELKLFASGA
jgi:RimJ/RimL family protein N-acetyltransferase